MVSLKEVVEFLDQELNTSGISDYPGAVNGLQLENSGEICRVVAAVDASLPVIQAAAAGGPGLLVVHHGIFWQGVQPMKGAYYRKLKIAMDAGLAIYSSHLPLDVHPEFGNNSLLAQAIGMKNITPFLLHKGSPMGVRGNWQGSRKILAQRLQDELGGPVHLCPGGQQEIESIGLITGGAGSEVAKVALTGVDTFITGEGPHWSYSLAEELGINLFYAGHYATETYGVKAISKRIAGLFKLPWSFRDHPSGL
jgi:dinuclear metal center YbgI/SA1388 family protein